MTRDSVLRLILIGIGLVFLMLWAAGAILELATEANKDGELHLTNEANLLVGITGLLEALGALWQVFAAAPLWLAFAGVGILIILPGAFLPLAVRS